MENTLVAFHTGRGGRFNNAGFTKFIGEDKNINYYASLESDIYVNPENHNEILDLIKGKENIKELYFNNNVLFAKRTGIQVGDDYYYHFETPLDLPCNNDGTGRLDLDGEYDTTVVTRLGDCDENDILMIHKSNNYKSTQLDDYCKTFLLERNMIFEDED